jgi:single-strand DNA-binding protein
MASICKVTLVGNLGADPEMRYTQAGKPVAKFRVACNNRRRTPDGEWQEHTEWFGVSAFSRLAEVSAELLHKGSRVYVEGRLESRTWDGPDGRRFFLDVIASEVILLDPRPRGEGGELAPRGEGGEMAPRVTAGAPAEEPDTLDEVPF